LEIHMNKRLFDRLPATEAGFGLLGLRAGAR
jgi:hypothetical protein